MAALKQEIRHETEPGIIVQTLLDPDCRGCPSGKSLQLLRRVGLLGGRDPVPPPVPGASRLLGEVARQTDRVGA